ncbi:MAG TPA: amino acid aminotransferase [Spirochaetales bacterium]|jgi:branched-subunit amino acid aminotransferase/4-amino-4-deoxychorismate lyase|nr:amino acid aminotransferase [Spirochaetales bacterium]
MIREHALRNGKIIPEEKACLPITNREVQFGFSTYESIRVIEAHPVHLEDHLIRLGNSCKGIGLEHPFTQQELSSWVHELIRVDMLEEASVRILLVGGKEPLCFITASPLLTYPDAYYTHGVGAITYEGERLMPSCKTGNLLLNYMALEKARGSGGFEALLIDRKGQALEGTRSNFFAFRDGRLYTAKDEDVLLGVTRERVIQAAKVLGIEVVYQAPQAKDLQQGLYDELFISATSMAAMPLSSLDGKAYKPPFDRTNAISALVRSWELET